MTEDPQRLVLAERVTEGRHHAVEGAYRPSFVNDPEPVAIRSREAKLQSLKSGTGVSKPSVEAGTPVPPSPWQAAQAAV